MQRFVLLAGAAALALSGAVAFAQGGGKGTPSAPRTAASMECSKQADAKGLHGKQRRAFRAKCKRDFKSFGYGPKS